MFVWHYSNNQERGFTMTSGEGAGSGALAGVVAGVVAVILSYLLQGAGIIPGPEEALSELYESGQFSGEQLDMMESIVLSPFVPIIGSFVNAIIGAILGAIGGALGVSAFAKGDV